MSRAEKQSLLPSKTQRHNNDQQPFLPRRTFSTLPEVRQVGRVKNLSLFFAVLCIIDLFGVFPIMSLPGPIIQCGIYGIPLVLMFAIVQIYTATLLGRCWIIAERLDPSIVKKSRLTSYILLIVSLNLSKDLYATSDILMRPLLIWLTGSTWVSLLQFYWI